MKNQPRNRETILIVDDMEINRDILGEMLRNDYHLIEASDGGEALALLHTNKIGRASCRERV